MKMKNNFPLTLVQIPSSTKNVDPFIQVSQGIAQAPVVVSNTCRGRDETEEKAWMVSNAI